MKTVLEVIQSTTAYFDKYKIESPRLNIELLLAHVLGVKRMELYLRFDEPLSDTQLEPLRELVKRRAAGEPLQHVLGTVEFHGRIFTCDKRALIPRPETEQLCEKLIGMHRGIPFTGRVVDVGVGSGVIAITLAAAWPEAHVEGVDLSPDALALSTENAATLGLAERVRFYKSDLIASVEGHAQLIVANLPYIAAAEVPTLSREVQHDPVSALDGGAVGTELIFRLIDEARAHLTGMLALEIGCDQGEAVCAELSRQNYHDIRAEPDYQDRVRFVFATYG